MIRLHFGIIFLIMISANLFAGKYLEVTKSLKELRQAIINDPNECLNYYELGLYFLSERKYDSAKTQFQRTLEIDSHFADAYFGLYVNEVVRSELLFVECLHEVPSAHSKEKVRLVNEYAKSAFMSSPFLDWRPAIVFFRHYKEVKKYPYYKEVKKYPYYKEVKKYPYFQEFVEDFWHFWIDGVENFFLGDYPEAIEEIDELLKIKKWLFEFHIIFLRGHAHARLKKFHSAAQDFKMVRDTVAYCNRHKLLPITLTPAILDYLIGHCYLNTNDFKKAEGWFRKCVEADSSFYTAYLQLSKIYLGQNDYDQAIKMLDKAIKINPNDPFLHFNKGAILAKLGRIRYAVDEYLRTVECNPHFCKVYFNLALVMEAIGKNDEAQNYYQKFIEYAPKRYQNFMDKARMKIDALRR